MKKIIFTLLTLIPLLSYSQTTVKGRVLDSNNFPLPGATVTAENSSEIAITDFNGYYSLFITGSDNVTVSYVGFETLSKIINESDENVTFILTPNVNELSEVIVSGFQGGSLKALNKQRNDLNITNIVSADNVSII